MTVHRGTMDVRNRVFSSVTLDWEAQSTGSGGGASSTVVTANQGLASPTEAWLVTFGGISQSVTLTDNVAVVNAAASALTVRSTITDFGATVRPSDTNFASSAGFHFNSSGELLTAGGGAGSTQVSVSTGHVTVDTGSIGVSSVTSISSLSTGHVTVDTGSIQVSAFAANLALPAVSSLSTGHVTVDTGSIQVSAFAAGAALAQVSSLSTGHVTVDTGSLTIAQIAAAAVLTQVSSLSTGHVTVDTGSIRVMQSTFSDLSVRPLQSTASDLKVSAFMFDSTGNAIETSTFAASTRTSTVRGLMVRQAVPDCTSASARLATAGDNTILTSAATSIYVYALGFSAALPTTGPSTGSSGANVRIQNGTTSANLWQINYQFSSLMTAQAPLAVTPPAYLFRTGPGNLLNANASATGGYISVSAWRE